jgi:hypothetical protein
MSVTEMVPISVLPAPETSGRSAVYRIFGDEQRLLYIGSSERPRQRWHEHRNRTAWWAEARAYSLTWLPTREAAYEAESLAIAAERPVFNQDWQPRQIPAPRPAPDPVEEVRRVADALDAVEQIADEEQRVKAKSRIMADQVERNKAWAQERTRLIRRLHHDEKLSYRQIAARLEIKLSAVQDAFRNYTETGEYRGKTARSGEE